MLQSLFFLIFFHALGDSALQTEFMGTFKHTYPSVMIAHVLVYSGVMAFGLKYLKRFSLWKAIFLLAGHFAIDSVSSWYLYNTDYSFKLINTVDQAFHFGQLLIVFIDWKDIFSVLTFIFPYPKQIREREDGEL